MLLRMWGHDVRLTYDGEAAIEMACVYRPDVLLLDIAMPKLDGCRLAQQLRRQTGFMDTLLVAITGYADDAYRLLCEAAGFDLFLIKPIDPATLETLLLLELDRLLGPPKARLVTPDQLAGDRAGPCSGHRARASARRDGTPVSAAV
jgi:CheY-like chemotaxis protein